MSTEKTHDDGFTDDLNRLGYELFRKGSVRRFNPSLFAALSLYSSLSAFD